MRRALPVLFCLTSLIWIAGCGNSYSGGGGGTSPTPNALNGQYRFCSRDSIQAETPWASPAA